MRRDVTGQEGFALFDPANVGNYPGRVEPIRPGDFDKGIFDMRASDDRDALNLTVQLSRTESPASPTTPLFKRAIAHIEWGSGAGRDFVDVDFLHGQMLQISATFVRVAVNYMTVDNVNPLPWPPVAIDSETFGASPPTDPAALLQLGASVTQGSHGIAAFGATPRLTVFADIPAAGLSAQIPIPNHAQSVTVLGNFTAAAGVVIHAQASTLSDLYAQAIPSPNLDQFAFPIAAGVDNVLLSQTGATDQLVLLLWTIGL